MNKSKMASVSPGRDGLWVGLKCLDLYINIVLSH